MSNSEEVYEKGTYGINLLYALFVIILLVVFSNKRKIDPNVDVPIIVVLGLFLISSLCLNSLCLSDNVYYNNDEDIRVGVKKSAMSFSVITIIGLITISGLFFGGKVGKKGEGCDKQIAVGCVIVFSSLLFILNCFGLATIQ